eukprot:scaffold8150_cov118-Cylindrotheca_fusiformis.AAC.14
MGNQSSSEGGGGHPRSFGRTGNALGLSRSELEKRCKPSGQSNKAISDIVTENCSDSYYKCLSPLCVRLYNDCHWDEKAIRRLVGDGKLAARLKGQEERTPEIHQECPICFLYYKDINVTKCCNASICTECFLQVRPQKEKQSTCPFCNSHKLSVGVAKRMTSEQLKEQEKEEQLVVEARIRSQSISDKSESGDNSLTECFGSSLQQDSRVALMRARSESLSSNNSGDQCHQKENIMSLAMSPEDRRRLEEEMRAQLSHPLTMRVEAEAAERRMQNERAYSRTSSSSSREMRAQRAAELVRRRRRGGRDWNQIVDAFERGGNGEIHSLDDLVVLEAAILLSMDEESRQARQGEDGFDAARHARDGFPLVRSFFANRREEGAEASQGSTSRRRLQATNSESSSHSAALDTASMLMRGISEEEQLAMAIAASLQDQNTNSENEQETDNDQNDAQNTGQNDSDDDDVYLEDEEGDNNADGDQHETEVAEEEDNASMPEANEGSDDAMQGVESSGEQETETLNEEADPGADEVALERNGLGEPSSDEAAQGERNQTD